MMMHCPHPQGPREFAPYFAKFVGGRRGEILDAALAVFAEKGYEAGTMREIASRLGVTEPALYRHYAGKEALFEDLMAVSADHILEKAGVVLDALDPTTLRESLLELVRARRRHVPRNDAAKPVMMTLFSAAPHNPASREVFRNRLVRPMVARISALVPRVDAYYGIERNKENLDSSLRAFMGLFVGHFMTGMILDLPDDDEGLVNAMMAVMGWPAEG